MANETDPLATRLSGTDPQSLMEYITRQRIYDSRYWKEECFGLTTAHVLDKATQLRCIGGSPTHFLSLTLKLLQLHPEHEIMSSTFLEQDTFPYVRALGALYIRLTSRPVDIYEALEPLYHDYRLLRVWSSSSSAWSTVPMDVWIDQLLFVTKGTTAGNCVGMALPRLPARRFLVEAGYLPEGTRPTALRSKLEELSTAPMTNDSIPHNNNEEEDGNSVTTDSVLRYLRHLAVVEKVPAAIEAWKKRQALDPSLEDIPSRQSGAMDVGATESAVEPQGSKGDAAAAASETTKPKKKKKKDRAYGNLFKSTSSKQKATKKVKTSDAAAEPSSNAPVEGSEEYWNEQRAKLGLGKLK